MSGRPAKLIPPELCHYYVRQPLMERLSRLLTSPGKVWISSPGGAGKSALVRNLLVDDPRPIYWYQVDSGDRDPANLFYYLAQAVADEVSGSPSLPKLEPEFQPNLEVFCRNFCRVLFARIGVPCVLVFDDLQEGPGEALFGPFLSALMAELPATSSLLLVSREEPYRQLARDRMNRNLAHLSWDDLRLSAEETRRFLNWSWKKEPGRQLSDQAYHLTQGWLSGLLLYYDSAVDGERPQQNLPERTDLLFDYFAGEVFAHTSSANREFLLLCGLLPSIDAGIAESLTGRADASEVLERLVRDNHFTCRIASSPVVYRFHPLFRQFLLSKADQVLGSEQSAMHRVRAACLLVAAGRSEPAAELLIEARAWTPLIEIIASQADDLLRQGRLQTLLQWLEALPSQTRDKDPWLCYWRGICLLATKPSPALRVLTRAFELFEEAGDTAGSMLSWGMVVNAMVIVWDRHTELDHWIERFDRLRKRHAEFPSLEIECLMVQGICKSLTWRNPSRADLPFWADRLYQLVTTSSDCDFRLLAGSNLVLYHVVSGDIAVAQSLVEVLNSDLHSAAVSPMKKLVWISTRAVLEWMILDRSGIMATLETGRSLIEEVGVHVLDVRLYAQVITLGLTTGDLPMVRRLFEEFPRIPIVTSLDHAYYSLLLAELSLQEGDTTKAIALAETAIKRAQDGGNQVITVMSYCVLVLALYEGGQTEQLRLSLEAGFAVSQGITLFKSNLHLLAAYFALQTGDDETAHRQLREGFELAASQGYPNFMPWRNGIMTRLCREALAVDIEVDYVKRLARIRQLDLTQPASNPLTPKEMETLSWVQEGKTTWEIARIQGISEATVKFHVGNILRKFGASSRTQAVAIALKAGLLKT